MNLKQLEVFIAVAETGSFSKGAELCFITQSTVSQHISALEAEFGVRLLDRTGRGALPTEAGKLLLERARRLMDLARDIPQALKRFNGMEEAVLKVAGSNVPGEYMIPAALPYLIGRYPGVSITLIQGDSREVQEKLLSEQAELGVVGGYFPDDQLEFTPFAKDEIVLIVAAGHRWAGSEHLAVNELACEPFVVREQGSGTRKASADALRQAGLAGSGRVAAHLGSNEAVKRAVSAGVGVAFVSAMSVKKELAEGSLVQVPVQGMNTVREFYLVQRRGRELSTAAQAFCEVMRDLFGEGNEAINRG